MCQVLLIGDLLLLDEAVDDHESDRVIAGGVPDAHEVRALGCDADVFVQVRRRRRTARYALLVARYIGHDGLIEAWKLDRRVEILRLIVGC